MHLPLEVELLGLRNSEELTNNSNHLEVIRSWRFHYKINSWRSLGRVRFTLWRKQSLTQLLRPRRCKSIKRVELQHPTTCKWSTDNHSQTSIKSKTRALLTFRLNLLRITLTSRHQLEPMAPKTPRERFRSKIFHLTFKEYHSSWRRLNSWTTSKPSSSSDGSWQKKVIRQRLKPTLID